METIRYKKHESSRGRFSFRTHGRDRLQHSSRVTILRNRRCLARTLTTVLLLVTTLCCSSLASSDAAGAETGKVVLRVNGKPVYLDELETAINIFVPATVFHGGVTPEVRERYRNQAMDLLISRELLYQAGAKEGMDVDSLVAEEMRKQLAFYDSRDAFLNALKAKGLDEGGMELRLRKDILAEAYVAQELSGLTPYSDEQVQKYYNENIETFRRPPSVSLQHIILRVEPSAGPEKWTEREKEARSLVELARNGVDFGRLARTYSEDDYRVVDGDMGWVHKGQLDPDLEALAFSVDEGEIGGPLRTRWGYHVLKITARRDGELLAFESVREGLRRKLDEKQRDQAKAGLLERLRREAVIEVLNE